MTAIKLGTLAILLLLFGRGHAFADTCVLQGTVMFQDGIPATGQFFLTKSGRRPSPVLVTADSTGTFALGAIECGDYFASGPMFDGTVPARVQVKARTPVKIVIAGKSWTPSTGAGTTVAEDEALAARTRDEFVKRMSPDDWYLCYSREATEPARRAIFERLYQILQIAAAGLDVPDEAYVNCNTSKAVRGAEKVGRTLLSRFRDQLMSVLQGALGIPDVGARAVAEAALRSGGNSGSDPMSAWTRDADGRAEIWTELATALVRKWVGEADAVTYAVDPPRVRAEKLLTAAVTLTERRAWPTTDMIFFADMGGGGSGRFTLEQFYDSPDHPDVKGWFRMTVRQRGEAHRRMRLITYRAGLETARGEKTLDDFGRAIGDGRMPADRKTVIHAVFGREMRDRYEKAESNPAAVEKGYGVDDIYVSAVLSLIVLLQVPEMAI